MSLANINEKLMDQSLHQRAGRVDAGNELWDDLKPVVDLDAFDALTHEFVHLRPLAIVKPYR